MCKTCVPPRTDKRSGVIKLIKQPRNLVCQGVTGLKVALDIAKELDIPTSYAPHFFFRLCTDTLACYFL